MDIDSDDNFTLVEPLYSDPSLFPGPEGTELLESSDDDNFAFTPPLDIDLGGDGTVYGGAKPPKPVTAIFVHSGAGVHSQNCVPGHLNACKKAAEEAMKLLRAGASAVDAVVSAIRILEDDEITNAGFGSNLTIDGQVELDASIVDHLGRSGGCGAVPNIPNPISVAKLVLDQSMTKMFLLLPNLLVGQGARDFAIENGIRAVPNSHLVAPHIYASWQRMIEPHLGYLRRYAPETAGPDRASFVAQEYLQFNPELRTIALTHENRGPYESGVHDQLQALWQNQVHIYFQRHMCEDLERQIQHRKEYRRQFQEQHEQQQLQQKLQRQHKQGQKNSHQECAQQHSLQHAQQQPPPQHVSCSTSVDPLHAREHAQYQAVAEALAQEQSSATALTCHPPPSGSLASQLDLKPSPDGDPYNRQIHLVCPHQHPSETIQLVGHKDAQHCPQPPVGMRQLREIVTSFAPESSKYFDENGEPLPFDHETSLPTEVSSPEMPTPQNLDGGKPRAQCTTPRPLEDMDLINDTVGAIAIDSEGRIAAGASSGGIAMKHRGRVGPAALAGVGSAVVPIHLDDPEGLCVAAVASGTGEHMVTTTASQRCAERFYHGTRQGPRGRSVSEDDDDTIMESFIAHDFMSHPGVREFRARGAIGLLTVKKSRRGIYFYFAHNTESFSVASMASTDREPLCVVSRRNEKVPVGSIIRGARKILL